MSPQRRPASWTSSRSFSATARERSWMGWSGTRTTRRSLLTGVAGHLDCLNAIHNAPGGETSNLDYLREGTAIGQKVYKASAITMRGRRFRGAYHGVQAGQNMHRRGYRRALYGDACTDTTAYHAGIGSRQAVRDDVSLPYVLAVERGLNTTYPVHEGPRNTAARSREHQAERPLWYVSLCILQAVTPVLNRKGWGSSRPSRCAPRSR